MRTHFLLFFVLWSTNQSIAQQLDPIHYPPKSEWEYLKTKQTDSLIHVMKFYFNADDTLFFREARSQQVVKVALTDLQVPEFFLGSRYTFANRFYGPDGANASRTSKNEKLDRFYYYYLNAPELRFTKVAQVSDTLRPTSAEEKSSPIPTIKSQPYAALKPQILLKNGCIIYPEEFYFLSDGQLYFGNGIRDNVYKVDTTAVQAIIGIEVGKNIQLKSKVGYVFGGRCMRFTGLLLGGINVGLVSSALSWDFSTGIGFFGTIPTGIIYIKLINKGTKRIQNKKRFKHARYAECSN